MQVKIFENESSATIAYPQDKTAIIKHENRSWRLVGESQGKDLTLKKRFLHVITLIGIIVGSILCLGIPFVGKDVQKAIRWHLQELKLGKEICFHCVPEKLTEWQQEFLSEVVANMKNNIQNNENIPNQPDAVCCCVSIKCDDSQKTVKKLFDFNDGFTLTKNKLAIKMEVIKTKLAVCLEEEIDVQTKSFSVSFVLLWKNEARSPWSASNRSGGRRVTPSGFITEGYSGGSLMNLNILALHGFNQNRFLSADGRGIIPQQDVEVNVYKI